MRQNALQINVSKYFWVGKSSDPSGVLLLFLYFDHVHQLYLAPRVVQWVTSHTWALVREAVSSILVSKDFFPSYVAESVRT